MEKIDLKKLRKPLFTAKHDVWQEINVPKASYLMIDGHGDPNVVAEYKSAIGWIYPVAYGIKFAAKAQAQDFVVAPLEGLWWADDPTSFALRRKDEWHWTLMIMMPDFVDAGMFEAAAAKAAAKQDAQPPPSLRLDQLAEGRCLQALHIGSYDEEGPLLARLHDDVMPSLGVTFGGPHHEIYLGDPRKAAPEKLKTILRQPIQPRA